MLVAIASLWLLTTALQLLTASLFLSRTLFGKLLPVSQRSHGRMTNGQVPEQASRYS